MIVVYGLRSKLDPVKQVLSDAIHQCMMTVLGMPEGKRAQRFVLLNEGEYFYPEGRTADYTVIEINMMAGRSKEVQKQLIKTIFEQCSTALGIDKNDIEITIKVQEKHQWGFRGMTGDEAMDLKYKVDLQ